LGFCTRTPYKFYKNERDPLLYLVSTPIGNLQDITYRAIETLNACDYILCEDTRYSQPFLHHHRINKPLKSFHKFNEAAKETSVIHDLLSGKSIALISDAGTPGISDPGTKLVQRCVEENIPVMSIPGPCALIAALSCSGLSTDRFQFYGFLPRKAGDLRHVMQEILSYPSTTICYESPHRIQSVIQLIAELAPNRKVVIARELTKKFEEILRGQVKEILEKWENYQVKGEFVLLIDGHPTGPTHHWEEISPEEHVKLMEETYHLPRNEAIKIVAELRGVPKRTIYNKLLSNDKELCE
jgi:16S rRNA (cytidine1402-2'-O)-methyltransferase